MKYTFRANDIYEANAYRLKIDNEVDFYFENIKTKIKVLNVVNFDITVEILDKEISKIIKNAFNDNKGISIGYKLE